MPLDLDQTWSSGKAPAGRADAGSRRPRRGAAQRAQQTLANGRAQSSPQQTEGRDEPANGIVDPADGAPDVRSKIAALAKPVSERLEGPLATLRGLLPNFGFKSLYWRILFANVTGLLVMLLGFIYLSQHQAWLIEAKRESLQAQGQIMATAIAESANGQVPRVAFPDPDKLLEGDGSANPLFRPYDVSNFEFSIQPDMIAPVLHHYTQPSGLRARIYATDGTLIYDTQGFSRALAPGERPARSEAAVPAIENFWTRLDSLFVPSNLKVYKEIGTANGTAYPEVRDALQQGSIRPILQVTEKGRHIVSVAVPIQRQKAVHGALLISTREGDIDGILRKERHIITWVFAIALAATALSVFFLAGTIAGPMRRLSDAANDVKRNISTRGELPVFPDRKDEIGQMAEAFRGMTEALYRRIELSEKFAADVAHELKNPVTAVRSATETLTYVKDANDREDLVRCVRNDLLRLDKLITDISNFSRLDAELSLHEAEPVDMAPLAEGIATTFNDMHGENGGPRPIEVVQEGNGKGIPATFSVLGHELRLGQVLTNLVDNAISFTPDGGKVAVRMRRENGHIEIDVEDDGPGVPADKWERIFDRFYTDRPASEAHHGKNSGLGLSISREIVEAHGGRIWVENRPGLEDSSVAGARFRLRLPAASTTASRSAQRVARRR
jgi:two-component system sensor histidine kinase ChvG